MLLPLMWFIFDETWDVAGASVYLTPMKVWGPLSFNLAVLMVFVPVAAVVLTAVVVAWYLIRRWINPNFRVYLKGMMNNG